MIDTHTHLFLDEFGSDRFDILKKISEKGVSRIIEAAIDLESNFRMRRLFSDCEAVFFGAGIHPLRVKREHEEYGFESCRLFLTELIRTEKTVAIGETGLDFHRAVTDEADRQLQRAYFKMQLDLARGSDMPLILHIRDCHEEALEILESYGGGFKGVVHCFIGSAETAKRYTNLGFYLGIGGSCTYSKHDPRLAVFIRDLPLLPPDRIVLETDSPYLAPSQYKGKRNTPLYLPVIAQRLGEAMGATAESILELTEQNALLCFSALR